MPSVFRAGFAGVLPWVASGVSAFGWRLVGVWLAFGWRLVGVCVLCVLGCWGSGTVPPPRLGVNSRRKDAPAAATPEVNEDRLGRDCLSHPNVLTDAVA